MEIRVEFENQKTKDMVDKIILKEGRFIFTNDWETDHEIITDVEIIIEKDNDNYFVATKKDNKHLRLVGDYGLVYICECDMK